jgi:predicted outer membrane repeat protein
MSRDAVYRHCRTRSVHLHVDRLESRRVLATFTVVNTSPSGAGSLRQAILDSNAAMGADVIAFSSAFSSPQTIVVTSPLPQIGSDLTITGPGSGLLTVRLNSTTTPVFGVFNSTAGNLTLSGMTVTGATISGNGAGLQSTGPGSKNLTFDDMVFTGLTASGLGGAVFLNNNTSLTIRNSVVSSNTAAGGGGICFFQSGSLLVENCTFTGNSSIATASSGGAALYFSATANSFVVRASTFDHNTSARMGGAVYLEGLNGNAIFQNSTFSDNSAVSGGAIAATGGSGSLTLQNSTVAGNSASASAANVGGGGLFRASTVANTLTLSNSIISGNTNASAPDIRTDPFSTLQANFCAIGSASGFSLASGSGNNLAFGAALQLGALAGNGGPTQTRAILAGSPLVNAGSNALTPGVLNTDQRGAGFPRVFGAAVDIGAFELQTAPAPTILQREFLFETAPHRIRLTFSQNVGASLGTDDVVLRDQTHAVILPASTLSLSYDPSTNRATFTVASFPSGVLPDARYRLTIQAAGITNSSGVPLAANELFDFHALAGDANRDQTVNFDDLLIVAQNYGMTGRTFSQGNFNYDSGGAVGFDDLLLLAQRYGTNLQLAKPLLVKKRSIGISVLS